MLVLLLTINACSENSNSLLTEGPPEQQISKFDGQPIVNIQAADLYHTDVLNQMRDKLASNHGRAIIRAFNEQTRLSSTGESPIIAVKDLAEYTSIKGNNTQSNVSDVGSSHLRITDSNGEAEDFVLTLRPYHKNRFRSSTKSTSKASLMSAENTYLALSPDRFYVQDDENGNENWPVTFPAVSLSDTSDKIMVTFNRDGLVSTSLDQQKGATQSQEAQLLLEDGTSACDDGTAFIECGGGGGGGTGGGGGGSSCTEIDNRGGETGNYPGAVFNQGNRTFFVITSMRLWATGDGDGAAELQMFVKQDDAYDGECFSGEYKYRFDKVVRNDPTIGFPHNHTKIQGADHRDIENYYYQVPDINNEDFTYDFFGIDRWQKTLNPFAPSEWRDVNVTFFPLFDISNQPGPWRLVLVDDDKDYKDFATNHVHAEPYYKDVQTYDMSTGTWSEVHTGFTTNEKQNGNSDDPIQESGVRRITEDNANDRMFNGSITATKNYSGGYFRYEFSLRTY